MSEINTSSSASYPLNPISWNPNTYTVPVAAEQICSSNTTFNIQEAKLFTIETEKVIGGYTAHVKLFGYRIDIESLVFETAADARVAGEEAVVEALAKLFV